VKSEKSGHKGDKGSISGAVWDHEEDDVPKESMWVID
jgi:hypothetical protein